MAKKVGKTGSKLDAEEREELLDALEARFEKNTHRHDGLKWADVRARLEDDPGALQTLAEMERTGGEPDVVGRDDDTGEYLFVDCSKQSPKGRRSVCYDGEARKSRKKHPPKASAMEMAKEMGAALLSEAEYRRLQDLNEVDTKTSSWLETPEEIRELGGAMFGDHRFGTVWVYHNGADSYYAARGFRCKVRV